MALRDPRRTLRAAACAPPSARRSCSRAAAGRRGRPGSPPAATSSGATSRTTGCCAGTSRPARSACSGSRPRNTNGQHGRPAGAPGHLRARQPARHAHRARRLDHRDRGLVRGQAAQQPQRRRRALRRLGLVHRPLLRDRVRLRGQPRRPASSTRCYVFRVDPGGGHPDRRRRLRAPERAGVLARRAPALRLRHRRRAVAHPLVRGRRRRRAVRRRGVRRRATAAASTASASTTTGRIWTSAGDGVHCLDPDGTLLGKVRIPEVVANVEFGGPKRNRLFMCATTSLYSVHLKVTGPRRWAASDPRR